MELFVVLAFALAFALIAAAIGERIGLLEERCACSDCRRARDVTRPF